MTDPASAPGSAGRAPGSLPILKNNVKSVFGTVKTSPSSTQPASPPTPPTQQRQVSTSAVTQDQALDTLDQVLTEVESSAAAEAVSQPAQQPRVAQPPSPQPSADSSQPPISPQDVLQRAQDSQVTRAVTESLQPVAPAAPQAIAAATDTLNPSYAAGGSTKEQLEAGVSPDAQTTDTEQPVGDITHLETEGSVEISPEVEAYLQKVQDHANQIPEEIVIADNGQEISTQPHIAQPVIVLPITEEIEKEGQSKNPTFSVRWLVEWSRKLMKMFSGKIIYREAPTDTEN